MNLSVLSWAIILKHLKILKFLSVSIQLEGKRRGDMDVKREEKHGRGLGRTEGWTEGAVFKTKINSRVTFCGYEEFMECKINRKEFLCCANYVAGFCVRLINEANKSSHFCRRFILIYRYTNLRNILCAKNSLDNVIFMKNNEEITHEILVIFLSWQKWHSLQEAHVKGKADTKNIAMTMLRELLLINLENKNSILSQIK